MKKIFVISFITIAAIACKKSTTNQVANISVAGIPTTSKWELRKLEGSIWGNMNYAAGNGQTIEFFGVDSFKAVYPASSISYKDSGTYTIVAANNVGDFNLQKKYYRNGISFTDNDSVRIVNNQLIFLAHNGWADEPTLYYDRL